MKEEKIVHENKTVHDWLIFIQKNIKVPKKVFNKFGNFNYRTLEQIVEAYKELATPTILIFKDSIEFIEGRFYVLSTATLGFKGEVVSTEAFAREQEILKGMSEAQITGATSSYARKYALQGLFAIDGQQDVDAFDNTQETKKALSKVKETPAKVKSAGEEEKVINFIQNAKSIDELKRAEEFIKKSNSLELNDLYDSKKKDLTKN